MEARSLRNHLELAYDELEEKNLEAKNRVREGSSEEDLFNHYSKYLESEKGIKAVTVCFSDIEGRLHMLDYDKSFLLKSYDNLTFDGSSVRGLTSVNMSDLRLKIDWGSFRWLPSDVFGAGKVLVFGSMHNADGSVYESDLRGVLRAYESDLAGQGMTANVSVECEGFLFEGIHAEQQFRENGGFHFVSTGGYYNSLPQEPLKLFIDAFAEAKRAMAFENEKDHPEVAPSQFELNYSYCSVSMAADQLQLYKLLARQIANKMGMTASFIPKPIGGINGSGMHTNMSVTKDDKNIFYDEDGDDMLSQQALDFVKRILTNADDLMLTLGSSVNCYRRLDPNFEAPNQIRYSAKDRTSMIRIPMGNEKSARVEVRVVAPDSNPYLVFYSLFKTGLEGKISDEDVQKDGKSRYLPTNIYDAIELFINSEHMKSILGAETRDKYAECKMEAANRCPKELGSRIKSEEILFHHEVTNQNIWKNF